MTIPRRTFLVRAAGAAIAVPTMGLGGIAQAAAAITPGTDWSPPMTEAEMLDVVSTFVPAKGRYKYEGGIYTGWHSHPRLLKILRGVFPQIPLLQPLLLVQRQSDMEWIEIQRVAA